jgi:hypothetical protein
MTTKADYTEEEWGQLLQAPLTTGMMIIVADLHVTSMMGEMKGLFKGMMEQPAPEGAQELVGSLLEDIKAKAESKEKIEPPETSKEDPEQVRCRRGNGRSRQRRRFLGCRRCARQRQGKSGHGADFQGVGSLGDILRPGRRLPYVASFAKQRS